MQEFFALNGNPISCQALSPRIEYCVQGVVTPPPTDVDCTSPISKFIVGGIDEDCDCYRYIQLGSNLTPTGAFFFNSLRAPYASRTGLGAQSYIH